MSGWDQTAGSSWSQDRHADWPNLRDDSWHLDADGRPYRVVCPVEAHKTLGEPAHLSILGQVGEGDCATWQVSLRCDVGLEEYTFTCSGLN